MQPILQLSDPTCREQALAGAKAARLAQLHQAGVAKIPPGFAIPVQHERMLRHPAGAAGSPHRGRPPESMTELWFQALDKLRPPLAVRSSATCEDSAKASFAGVFVSLLGIRDAAGFVEAVEAVWHSLTGDAARLYAERLGLDLGGEAMAVLVQELVPASKAGVMYTRFPPSGRTIIEVCEGLADGQVAGAFTPTQYQLDRAWPQERSFSPGAQREAMVVEAGALRRRPVSRQCALTSAELNALLAAGVAVERFFGTPQDIEFAIASDLHVVQARPLNR